MVKTYLTGGKSAEYQEKALGSKVGWVTVLLRTEVGSTYLNREDITKLYQIIQENSHIR